MARRHFFKVLMPGFTENLAIPVTFCYEQLSEEKGRRAILRTTTGGKGTKSWRVEMSKSNEGIWSFKGADGWDDFMQQHDLNFGDFVVFEHLGNLVFNVFVFDPSSTCQKDFPPPQSHHHHHHDQPPHHHHHHRRHRGHHHHHDDKKSTLTNDPAAAAARACSPAGFTSTITASNLNPHRPYLNIPTKFAKWNGLKEIKGMMITIRDEEGRSWPMKLRHCTNRGVYERSFIGAGWYEFSESNGLKAGDICVLELDRAARINEGLIVLDAHIFTN